MVRIGPLSIGLSELAVLGLFTIPLIRGVGGPLITSLTGLAQDPVGVLVGLTERSFMSCEDRAKKQLLSGRGLGEGETLRVESCLPGENEKATVTTGVPTCPTFKVCSPSQIETGNGDIGEDLGSITPTEDIPAIDTSPGCLTQAGRALKPNVNQYLRRHSLGEYCEPGDPQIGSFFTEDCNRIFLCQKRDIPSGEIFPGYGSLD